MRNKWILLDETQLRLVTGTNGVVLMFEFKDNAVTWAKKHLKNWQVIEIPFDDEDMR